MAERGALLDMALDEIIKGNETRGRGRGRGGFRGGQRRGPTSGGAIRRDRPVQRRAFTAPYQKRQTGGGDSDGFWQHDRFEDEEEEETPRRVGVSSGLRGRLGDSAGGAGASKVQVANLEHTVTAEDLEELFGAVGQLDKVFVKYDRSGRSLGIAEVQFGRKADALKAIKEYNGVSLDGKPMALSLVAGVPTSLSPATYTPRERTESRPTVRVSLSGRPAQQSRGGFVPRGGSRGGRGGGSRGGRGGFRNRNQSEDAPSSADLDAELDAYMEQS